MNNPSQSPIHLNPLDCATLYRLGLDWYQVTQQRRAKTRQIIGYTYHLCKPIPTEKLIVMLEKFSNIKYNFARKQLTIHTKSEVARNKKAFAGVSEQ